MTILYSHYDRDNMPDKISRCGTLAAVEFLFKDTEATVLKNKDYVAVFIDGQAELYRKEA